ncbi:flippase [Thermococcus sp.]|uniref:flippase n=1 Tax=Thermococcus sp. TaxID=35749 RepID=UPI0025F46235|nr:flippase [Thermococcus sp.]
MSEVSSALQRIARGAGITIIGTATSLIMGFLSRALIARGISLSDYGLFNLTITTLSLFLTVAALGIPNSMPRQIPYYLTKRREEFPELISTATFITLISGLITTGILFSFSGIISRAFTDPAVSWGLRITSLSAPFMLLTSYIISFTLGLGRVRERFYYQQILRPLLWLGGVGFLYLTEPTLRSLLYLWVLLSGLIFLILNIDIKRLEIVKIKPAFDIEIARELILFSLPLMLSGILWTFMTKMDTLMVGHYLPSSEVGLYNAAVPLASLLPFVLTAINTLYVPMATPLFAKGSMKDLTRLYQIVTKWILVGTLPFFALLFVFPETSLGLVFGSKYLSASLTLQILAVGFMFHTILGPNGLTLTVVGKTGFLTVSTALAVLTDFVLNMLLIPRWRIEGAAVATAVSYLVVNLANSWKLYSETGIHPFSRAYTKSLVLGAGWIAFLKVLVVELRMDNIWNMIVLMGISVGIYPLLLLMFKVIEKEDIELMIAVEKKFGLNLSWVRKIAGKFL